MVSHEGHTFVILSSPSWHIFHWLYIAEGSCVMWTEQAMNISLSHYHSAAEHTETVFACCNNSTILYPVAMCYLVREEVIFSLCTWIIWDIKMLYCISEYKSDLEDKLQTYNKINGAIRRHFGKQMNKETKN